jgi:hypothetical protein
LDVARRPVQMKPQVIAGHPNPPRKGPHKYG